ncbi:glucosaminidase domain-containing protein [Paenibacillus taiwanensis]|uniref:glucosaminidase domain-containing protein n=1 Tax=Paenibacillus taiwanensis TaxID=401638 RepID=UPI00042400D1|nr:glucosaminidase domain-containing protein [Paenibacillus taiwanensis]
MLSNTGDLFAKYGKKYGIDPALLAAISMHETGNGTSNAARNKNNLGGMMDPKSNWQSLMTFDSIEDGIDAMARNLKKNYFDQGLNSIDAIARKYAPQGAANDPRGLNKYWTTGVNKFYSALSGRE